MTTSMTAPTQTIGGMSSNRVFLSELLSSRARLRFPSHTQAATTTPVRRPESSERQTGISPTVSLQGVTPGQQFYLSTPPMGSSGFLLEMQYLQEQGIDPYSLPWVLTH